MQVWRGFLICYNLSAFLYFQYLKERNRPKLKQLVFGDGVFTSLFVKGGHMHVKLH